MNLIFIISWVVLGFLGYGLDTASQERLTVFETISDKIILMIVLTALGYISFFIALKFNPPKYGYKFW